MNLFKGWKTNVTALVVGVTAAINHLVTGEVTLTQAAMELVAVLGLVFLAND